MAKIDTVARTGWFEVDSDLVVLGGIAVLTLLVDTVGTWGLSAVAGVGLRPLALLVMLTTVTVGTKARWGLAAGLLVSGLFIGNWPTEVATMCAAFGAATICGRLWDTSQDRTNRSRWTFNYVVVAVATTLMLAATTAWLSDLFGVAAFSIVVSQSLSGNLVLVLLGVPAAWVLVGVRSERRIRDRTETLPTKRVILTLGTLVIWVGGGYVGSFLYQAAGTVTPETFGRRLGAAAERIVVFGGPQGRYAVFLLGILAVLTLVVLFRHE